MEMLKTKGREKEVLKRGVKDDRLGRKVVEAEGIEEDRGGFLENQRDQVELQQRFLHQRDQPNLKKRQNLLNLQKRRKMLKGKVSPRAPETTNLVKK